MVMENGNNHGLKFCFSYKIALKVVETHFSTFLDAAGKCQISHLSIAWLPTPCPRLWVTTLNGGWGGKGNLWLFCASGHARECVFFVSVSTIWQLIVATKRGKDGNGLQLEKIGQILSSS